ncbi:hypothetical protein ON010_g5154 [Phytophthora cinnamomi]|nr:hypothetical protein ON010_g5154 [Phytophthora cinnamomi]
MATSALQSLGAVQISSDSEIFPSVIQLAAPRKGPLFRTVMGSSKDFTSCSRDHIVQLCRGIQDGMHAFADDTVAQVDTDRGDTVLHYFLQSFVQQASFPSVEEQRQVLSSPKWLGTLEAPRFLRILISKPNWEGKTPLHIASELGALGFCEVLIEMGASAKEECQAPDNRLLDQPTENPQFWKPINFAATVKAALDEAHAPFEERSALVEYLLKEPESLPDEENAAHDCKEKIQLHFPLLLPLFIRVEDETKHKEDYAEAEELYYKFLDECYPRFKDSTVYDNDPSGVTVHNVFLNTIRYGIKTLKKVIAPQCVIESTGDTLLHLTATHGHPDFAAMIKYLVDTAGLDINKTNKQLKTALHVAVEHNMPEVCLFLISQGADVTASCQNLETPSKEVWHTPLYTALWSSTPKYEIIEILLSTPQSIAKPRNPKLNRSVRYEPGQGPDTKWNGVVLEQLLKVHASALPLFLDHYAVEVNRINGEKVYRFVEVFEICDHLELIVNPTGTLTPSLSSQKTIKNSAVTHPVVRNAVHLKWELFGADAHRKQLSLYVLMVTFFYLSNLLLPKMEVATDEDGKRREMMHKWIEFDSVADYFVGITKVCCWSLAVYHLLYVEFFKEWRSNPKQYWRIRGPRHAARVHAESAEHPALRESNAGAAGVVLLQRAHIHLRTHVQSGRAVPVPVFAAAVGLLRRILPALPRGGASPGPELPGVPATDDVRDCGDRCGHESAGRAHDIGVRESSYASQGAVGAGARGCVAPLRAVDRLQRRPEALFDAQGPGPHQRLRLIRVRYQSAGASQLPTSGLDVANVATDGVDEAEMANITEAITTQVMKHVHDEVEALRMQVTTELQDVRELLETTQRGSTQAQKDVASKLDDVLKLLGEDKRKASSRTNSSAQIEFYYGGVWFDRQGVMCPRAELAESTSRVSDSQESQTYRA